MEPASGVRLLEQDPAPGPRDEGLVELRPSAAGTRRLALVLEPAGAVATSGQAERAVSPLPAREADPLVELLRAPGSVTLWALLLALLLGALHALAPGHGKALVAAYLVGQRGTARHALLLGLVVTFTHVSSVLALGLAALAASAYVLPERLSPYLTGASGALIVVIGGGLLRARWRAWKGVPGPGHEHGHEHEHEHGHEHGHEHEHEPRGAVSLRSLLGLGVAGGLVPCPSALVVLLLALALGRIAEGLALIVAFSLGLAAVLVAIGLAVVRAGRLVDRLWPRARWLAALPLVSAVVVTLVGLGVTAGGLRELASRGWLPGP